MPFVDSDAWPPHRNDGEQHIVHPSEAALLSSLMPKKEIGADRFLEAHPDYDGRGVVIAIFDTGVDPAAAGLQMTSDGKNKILDVIDCSGSGDIDTTKIVKADANGHITGASGLSLILNPEWKNPSGEWHVGCKLVYELFHDDLTSRLKKERKKRWEEKNQIAISEALKHLNDFDERHVKLDSQDLKKDREELQSRVDFLQKQSEAYDDKGPLIDAVVWHDGHAWRVALDTQSLDEGLEHGKLAGFIPFTNYRDEKQYGIFSTLDACSFVTNVYEEGKVLSIVTDSGPHGTHVAGIATAYHSKDCPLNGVAPGAQIISCKIGDSRLGSMETGTGLIRAVIAAVEHKCDLINMSYGEPTLLPDYGRFIELVNEVVNKYRMIFISSCGNAGPALSTVRAPGGTSSSIIGVGAYVSPDMAAAAYSIVVPPKVGQDYTWSSRGPAVDGDLGVCISAPGAAVAPVPTWTLQRRMLMNGTSMASPSACGGVALIISALKAENYFVSPYTVRRALENTASPISCFPEDKLTTGHGLLHIDRAYEYIVQSVSLPRVWYPIKINQIGKSTPVFRGIYIREASLCQQITEWTVQVEPLFHEDASKMDEMIPFEQWLQLHSSDKSVARIPEHLLLTNHGRSFSIVVDPTNLSDGVHYFEVCGMVGETPWLGPLFRIPVTIIKPMQLAKDQPPRISFFGMSFLPGHIERRFFEVPLGATWIEASMKTSGFDTARRFFIDTIQIFPLERPDQSESIVTFTSPSLRRFIIPVKGGHIMELAVAQFWSSGIGSQGLATVDVEVHFHGIIVDKESLVLDGSDAPVKIDVTAHLLTEKLVPTAVLNKIRIPYHPVDSKLATLSAERDKLPSGEKILALTLTYKFSIDDEAEVVPSVPLLNNRIYDTTFGSQFYIISDINKRVYAVGDAYPKPVKLPKGDYNLQLYLRHDNLQYLEKMKQLVLFIQANLTDNAVIPLNFFSTPDGSITRDGAFQSSHLFPGITEAFYVGPPVKDKLPKKCPHGAILLGEISYGESSSKGDSQSLKERPVSYAVSYIVPPIKLDEIKRSDVSPCKRSIRESLMEEVRDSKIKFLSNLKQETDEDISNWRELCTSLKSEYPKYTYLLAKILEGLLSRSLIRDRTCYYKEIVHAADEVVESIDTDELAKCLHLNADPEDTREMKIRKKMEETRDELVEALYQKGLALAEIESLMAAEFVDHATKIECSKQLDPFEENIKELKKWVDIKCSKYGLLLILHEKRCRRPGLALKVLDDILKDEPGPPRRKLYELKICLVGILGWAHLVTYENEWLHVRFPLGLPLL